MAGELSVAHQPGGARFVLARDGKSAIIVQASTDRLCANYGVEQTLLCRDTRRALTDIARRLETRVAR